MSFPPSLSSAPPRSGWLSRLLLLVLLLLVGAPLLLLVAGLALPPPLTPLMLIRAAEGEGMTREWVPLARISPHLQRAVIAAEDAKFCSHYGFDWDAVERAVERYQSGGRVLGASTISMQTAKNLFLWPGRDFVRKGLEAWLTVLVEAVWPKQRILEVYLNIVEWGPGLYGAEAAARHWFAKPAARLEPAEAARLAAILPNPRRWSPVRPAGHVAAKARVIQGRMTAVALVQGQVCPGR